MSTYNKIARDKLVERGKCRNCCGAPLVTETLCTRCRDLIKVGAVRQRERLIDAGLCIECGRVPPTTGKKGGRLRCKACAIRATARNKKRLDNLQKGS